MKLAGSDYYALIHDDARINSHIEGVPSSYYSDSDMVNVRLHLGGRSHACVTIPSDNDWAKIRDMLENTSLGDPVTIDLRDGGGSYPNFGRIEITGDGFGAPPFDQLPIEISTPALSIPEISSGL